MDTVDLEVKIKFLEKSQEKLMDLYLDALIRITNLEKYIQSVNINFIPKEEEMQYSPKESPKKEDFEDKDLEEEEPPKPVMYKRVYTDDESVSNIVAAQTKDPVILKERLWDMNKDNEI